MTQYKLKVLGGIHYPKPGECFQNGVSVTKLEKGAVFTTLDDLRVTYPNRFELINETEVNQVIPVGVPATPAAPVAPTASADKFPTATAAGLVVKSKKIKGKGERYFVHDPDLPDSPLNKKSLGEDEVAKFVKSLK